MLDHLRNLDIVTRVVVVAALRFCRLTMISTYCAHHQVSFLCQYQTAVPVPRCKE